MLSVTVVDKSNIVNDVANVVTFELWILVSLETLVDYYFFDIVVSVVVDGRASIIVNVVMSSRAWQILWCR